jgi:hypothetical protein
MPMNTQRARRLRIWIEAALTTISAVTFVLTLVAHDWIEQIVGASPDQGSGEIEWLLAGAAIIATLVFGSITTLEWRRIRTGTVPT